ncbi:Polygalacturonase [Pseudobythopirellula maris]|uniref:Polygalacturonase n=1 Tax=Pseudobythopirellula maris TaxID=2527991 RepID=A0A5C5ZTX5_9BACT|nr:glycoside hydrolase family 28 protein [Pseudobythopirellula maris]TWT91024.1 Polygalacturonase [Pseudobythopirellula maris]
MRYALAFPLILAVAAATAEPPMPTAESVGPEAMPHEVAPVEAPFDLPAFARPTFPDRTISIADRGAVEGGEKLATVAIQSSIDEASAAGGGVVAVPAGEWLTGRITLKSNVNLRVEKGAVLKFSGEIEAYLPVVFTRNEGIEIMGVGALIYAHDQENIAVTGGGELRGPDDGPAREAWRGLSDQIVDPTLPVAERVFDGREGRHYFRPYFISPIECRGVWVEGVTLRNGPMWNIVPVYCEGVVVRGVTIHSQGVVNGDGVNIESCRNVLVEYCRTDTGDDCYALKAGRDKDGLRTKRPVENVVIRRCHAEGGFGGVTCGSETAGGVRNLLVEDCVFDGVRHCAYMKTRRPRGGGVEKVWVRRVAFDCYNHGVFFDMIGSPMYVGELGERLPKRELTDATPYYRDIHFSRLVGTAGRDAFKIKGLPESPATRVLIERTEIEAPSLINLTDTRDLTVRDSVFRTEEARVQLLDTADVTFERTHFETPGGAVSVELSGPDAGAVAFLECEPPLTTMNVTADDPSLVTAE